jgi:hypothetical protein
MLLPTNPSYFFAIFAFFAVNESDPEFSYFVSFVPSW